MLIRVLPVLIFSLLASNGSAQVDPRIQKHSVGLAPPFGAIVKKGPFSAKYCPSSNNGNICIMNQSDAKKYCQDEARRLKRDIHLPNARELAQLSADMMTANNGAKAIIEVAEYKNESNYALVEAENTDGSVDRFYFNSVEYNVPSGDLGKNWFWSSSFDANLSGNAYDLNGYTGGVESHDTRIDNFAVRCVFGPFSQ